MKKRIRDWWWTMPSSQRSALFLVPGALVLWLIFVERIFG